MKDSPPSPFMSNRIQDSMARRGVAPQEQSQLAETRRETAALTSEPIRDVQARQRRLHVSAEDQTEDEAAARLDGMFAPVETKEALQDQVAQLAECNRRQQATIAYLRQRLRAPENGPDGSQAAADRAHRASDIPLRQDPPRRAEMERRPGYGRSSAVESDDDIPF
jgi:hypothetical protein